MSPENCGVFQLLKEVIFRRILAFFTGQSKAIYQIPIFDLFDEMQLLENYGKKH